MQNHKLVLGLKDEKEKMHNVCVRMRVCACVHTHATVQGVVISPCRTKFELNSPLAPHLPLVRNFSVQKH